MIPLVQSNHSEATINSSTIRLHNLSMLVYFSCNIAFMMSRLLRFLFLLFVTNIAIAQQPIINTSTDIYLQLKKLKVLGSVLYIAAHPDDENNTLLPYLAKEKMYRTAYLSLTRGDGGQNLIGSEQGVDLG